MAWSLKAIGGIRQEISSTLDAVDREASVNERVNALAGIATPAVLIDLDKVERNIKRLQDYADGCGLKVRPHIKTHKLPQIAAMQLKAGAIGVTCQKVSEAEAMVAGTPEIRDVLITYNIIGAEKLDRLATLAKKVNLSVVADNETVIDGLRKRFVSEAKPLAVFVECDTGANRCGVATPEDAVALAETIAKSRRPDICRLDDLSAAEWHGQGAGLYGARQSSDRGEEHPGARHYLRRHAVHDDGRRGPGDDRISRRNLRVQ